MIVDCHTHIWQSPDQLGELDLGDTPKAARPRPSRMPASSARVWRQIPAADPEHHWAENSVVDRSIVLAFKSRYLNAEIPNRYVADYVRRYPHKLIGFAGVDPTEQSAADELRTARNDLLLRGLTLSPANQDFHPADSRALRVYEVAEELGMPVLVHPVSQFSVQAKMEYARPYLWDEVLRTFPKLRLIMAQMGHPWIEETVCLLGKHANVFADISGLLIHPWQAYNALLLANEYQVIDKLLFGSDFPYTIASDCIEAMYSVNQLTQGTNFPVVPREALRGIVERDTLGLLGLA
jgi:predicted TIM-barrel fold metal-dependent hydrolase